MYSRTKRKKRLTIGLVFLLIATLTIAVQTSAHVPIISSGNASLATATLIPDPTKSWVVYAALHGGGEARYYKFEASRGQLIHLTLLTTTSIEDAHFTPRLYLMGPSIPNHGFVPGNVDTPPLGGVIAVERTRAEQATYEAFAPGSFIVLADISLSAPANGTYYVAVQDADGGHYGLAIGDRESFTISEWILTPVNVLSVYSWEWQSPFVFIGPALAIFVLGFTLLIRRQHGRRLDTIGFIIAFAGVLCVGTGANVGTQMILSINRSHLDTFVIITLIFTIFPIILGLLAIRIALSNTGNWTLRSRCKLILLGVGAFAIWAGFFIGPILAITAAFIPSRKFPGHQRPELRY